MSDEAVVGIDVGTSSSKAVLARPDGVVLRTAQRQHRVSLPRPAWAEQDADAVWWGEVRDLCRELEPEQHSVSAICVSGVGPCLLPCDAQVRPLRPAILYGIDGRATAEIAELDRRYGTDAILARGGSALSSQAVGPKLLWLRRNEPDVWASTHGWYMPSSFAVARLTGEYVLDHHSASQCDPLYDLGAEGWAADWADEIAPGVPLPRLAWPGEVVGTVTARAGADTGLAAGTPVVAGTIDAWAEAFGAGVRAPGDLMLMYGSTLFFVQLVESATPSRLLWLTQGVEPGRRSLAAGMSTSGTLVDWLRDLVGNPPWEELLAEAERVPPGARGLLMLPYFAGERTPVYDPQARGVVAGLTLAHGRGELLRSAYEAVGFGVRQILPLLAAAGGPPRRVVAVGGGTHAALWLQIVSDITGIAQEVPEETIGASYGDALLAAIGAGLVAPETDWSRTARVVAPDPSSRAVYDEGFALYEALYPATAELVHALAAYERPSS